MILSLSGFPLRADQVIWKGGNGIWDVASNWNTGNLPTAADDVFNNNSPDTISINDGSTQYAGTLTNHGTIDVSYGTLNVASTVLNSTNTGTFTVSDGNAINMTAATFTNSGLIDASNGGNVNFTVTTGLSNSAAGVIATDATSAANGSTLTFNGAGGLDNAGFIGSTTLGSGGSVSGTLTGVFTNESTGTLVLDSGSNLTLGNTAVSSSNAGTITVSDSYLTNNSFLTLNAATFTNTGIIDASNEGQAVFNVVTKMMNEAGATIATDYTFSTNGGTLVFNGAGSLDNAGFIGSKTIGSGGSVTGSLTGAFTNESTGTLVLDSGSNLTLGNTAVSSSNAGTVAVTTSSNLTINASSFTNTGAVYSVQQSGININAPIVLGGGSLTVGTNSTITTTGSLTQTGGITQVDGTLANSSPLLLQGGKLIGSGSITGSVNNTGGTVQPGDVLGTLTVQGTFTQGASGKTEIDLGGTQQGVTYDLLQVTNLATLGGELDVKLVDGFTPTPGGEYFTFMTYGSRSGMYDTITQLPGYLIGVNYNDAAGIAVIGIEAVPEGSTLVSAGMMLGVGALLLRRHARKPLSESKAGQSRL